MHFFLTVLFLDEDLIVKVLSIGDYKVGYRDPWPREEVLDVLEMIRQKIRQANYISNEQKNLLFQVIGNLTNEL